MSRIATYLLALLAVASPALSAQTASATANGFLQAQSGSQWQAMAEFVDSSSLHVLRGVSDKLAASLAAAQRPEVRAAMDSMGGSAMGQAIGGLQAMFGGSMLQTIFAHVTSADSLRAMSDRELMARWFEAKSFAYATELMMSTMFKGLMDKLPAGASAEMQTEMDKVRSQTTAWQVIGEILEGDTVAHVAYRIAGQTPEGASGVLTLRKSSGTWYVHFTDPDDQLAAMATLGMKAMQAKIPPH
jgi:hypothetical protein